MNPVATRARAHTLDRLIAAELPLFRSAHDPVRTREI
jgi:hypothetical protein